MVPTLSNLEVPPATSALIARQPDVSAYNLTGASSAGSLASTHASRDRGKANRTLNRSRTRRPTGESDYSPPRPPLLPSRSSRRDPPPAADPRTRDPAYPRSAGGAARRSLITGNLARFT